MASLRGLLSTESVVMTTCNFSRKSPWDSFEHSKCILNTFDLFFIGMTTESTNIKNKKINSQKLHYISLPENDITKHIISMPNNTSKVTVLWTLMGSHLADRISSRIYGCYILVLTQSWFMLFTNTCRVPISVGLVVIIRSKSRPTVNMVVQPKNVTVRDFITFYGILWQKCSGV